MKCPYDVIAFDLWDTLITRPFRENLYRRLSLAIGCGVDRVIEVARLTWFREAEPDRASFARRLADFLALNDDPRTRADLAARAEAAIVEHERQEAMPVWATGARNTLAALRESGVGRVLVTNASAHTRRLLERSWLRDEVVPLVDEVLLSCDVGFTKPDPRLPLASGLVRKAVAAGRLCVIGDQFDTDILVAQILGADAILVRNSFEAQAAGLLGILPAADRPGRLLPGGRPAPRPVDRRVRAASPRSSSA